MLITKTITSGINRHPLQLGLNQVTVWKFLGIPFRKDILITVPDLKQKTYFNNGNSTRPEKI